MTDSGICHIKPEFVIHPEHPRELSLECVSEKDKKSLEATPVTFEEAATPLPPEEGAPPPAKKPRWAAAQKKLRGQNKSRGPTFRVNHKAELCHFLVSVNDDNLERKCERNNCKFLHDIDGYLKVKPKDISDECYNYKTFGKCPRGLACRFGRSHITDDGKNKVGPIVTESVTKNQLQFDIQTKLRKRTYNFDFAESLIKYNDRQKEGGDDKQTSGAITDEDIIKLITREKKTIDWKNKLFLSPLTTVGNLPFRRICKEYGADVTCGEMAMCTALLQGTPREWALVKRHESEDIFGVQLCANNPHLLVKCGQLLQQETSIDFIDLNMGCPIDMVYKQGGGCGLLRRQRVLESCVKNMSQVLTIPFTVKTRTGIHSDENLAHLLAPKFRDWGASLLTIHGRSREQRYTKSANWDYIRQVAQAADPLPVFGNGDILSYDDYKRCLEAAPELSGVMIGRGALIKPWIFTEIKEKKLWDISSSERFDILKKYTNYGLEHWGSDNLGVENTRRFLLEWLSFLYRYVPVGLLENPPQKINERPPFYKGRDDLETLMASASASDWIKISEMLLGSVPENFCFLPKHKANSYK